MNPRHTVWGQRPLFTCLGSNAGTEGAPYISPEGQKGIPADDTGENKHTDR